jgi:CSLREA domain-containing protein
MVRLLSRLGLSAALAVAVLLVPAAVAGAATIKVTTADDEYGVGTECSLRDAVTAANTDTPYGGCPAGSGTGRCPAAERVRVPPGAGPQRDRGTSTQTVTTIWSPRGGP